MWSEKLGMNKVLFNTNKDVIECLFSQSMWFEKLGMNKVLFNTYKDVIEC